MSETVKKYFLVLGGFFVFLLTLVTGLVVKNEMIVVLQNAVVGCIIGGLLAKVLQYIIEIHLETIRKQTFGKEVSLDKEGSKETH